MPTISIVIKQLGKRMVGQMWDVLQAHGQQRLVDYARRLPADQQHVLLQELKLLPWNELPELIAQVRRGDRGVMANDAARAAPPRDVVRQPQTPAEHAAWKEADARGRALLAQGQVAAIVVAGGQGTRLGFEHPKGLFPIGPVSGRTLFAGFFEQIAARSRQAGRAIPYALMTSRATHAETIRYLEQQHRFGLPAEQVSFVCQGEMPAIDAITGDLLLATPQTLALNPDGHGGLLSALHHTGQLDRWEAAGVKYLFYHQVDNPATRVCEPALLGWHDLHGADVTTKVAAKVSPEERMGAIVDVNGATQIIEYSDLSPADCRRTDSRGQPVFWAGNTAIHVFSIAFLKQIAGTTGLPFHLAHKAVTHLDFASGQLQAAAQPNAIKFERFIFDVLPLARRSLVVEADRPSEFLPVKNKSGADSPDSVRRGLLAMWHRWLAQQGVTPGAEAAIEIRPSFALCADDLAGRLSDVSQWSGRCVLE